MRDIEHEDLESVFTMENATHRIGDGCGTRGTDGQP